MSAWQAVSSSNASPVTLIGDNRFAGGAYVLRIRVSRPLSVTFGRFNAGTPVAIAPGTYIYTGSALAPKGPSSLCSRLIRHATRSQNQPPHAIRQHVADAFVVEGLWNGRLPAAKKLFWNVDHLLDRPEAEIDRVLAVRTCNPVERAVAQLIEYDPHTSRILRGLGANDSPGGTHLLRLDASEDWWQTLPDRLRFLTACTGHIPGN
jgi:Uri superfamily endonuclease